MPSKHLLQTFYVYRQMFYKAQLPHKERSSDCTSHTVRRGRIKLSRHAHSTLANKKTLLYSILSFSRYIFERNIKQLLCGLCSLYYQLLKLGQEYIIVPLGHCTHFYCIHFSTFHYFQKTYLHFLIYTRNFTHMTCCTINF